MRLLLFDIDGTLLHTNGAGKAAMVFALEQLFGTSGPSAAYRLAGKTDKRIIMDLLTAAGIDGEEIEARLPEVYAVMADRARHTFGKADISCCPGVRELLDELRASPDVLLGLLTGNNELIAPMKLAAAGLDPGDFAIAASGSQSLERNELPSVAWQRARALTGQIFDGAGTVIIGDTPADIICAGVSGSTSLAVATGGYSAAALAGYDPDHLVDTLADTRAVLDILLQRESVG
jgi:phosphoglycolate phosphatase